MVYLFGELRRYGDSSTDTGHHGEFLKVLGSNLLDVSDYVSASDGVCVPADFVPDLIPPF